MQRSMPKYPLPGRGVLAMANNGPHTNGSQVYILYKSAHHLDYKHTIFGRVVGGLQTLTAMERVPGTTTTGRARWGRLWPCVP